ncbi:MAG: YtxH domain-containing protein [Candidatus Deferrimicrobiaceae bacterium]
MAGIGNAAAKVASGLVAGAVIGAGIALLFAPQSGKNTRKDILYHSKRGRRKAKRILEDFSDTVSDMVDTLGDNTMSVVEKGKDAVHEAKRGVLETIEEGQERLGKQREKLTRLIG